MANNQFYNDILEKTKQNYETRLELESLSLRDQEENMVLAIQTLFYEIVQSDYKNVITETASKGFNRCCIHSFTKSDTTGKYSTAFLFNGPVKNSRGHGTGRSFFVNIGIEGILQKLKTELSPFKVFCNFNNKTNIYTIDVSW